MRKKYDNIIIGSGIGGLICANYLARVGKKTLIIEKNYFVGGCCSSFTSKGYFFDSGPHILNGTLMSILKDLEVYEKKDFMKMEPLVEFFLKNKKYFIKSDFNDCRDYLKKKFPTDNIDGFFSLLEKNFVYWHSKLKDKVFTHVLDEYFKTQELKAIFYAFIFCLGNLPEITSAIFALQFIKTMLLFGGFYPKHGMQGLSNNLLHKFSENNGQVMLNDRAVKILIKNKTAYGILDSKGNKIFADNVISNIGQINTSKMLSSRGKSFKNVRIGRSNLTDSCLVVHIALKDHVSFFKKNASHMYIKSSVWEESARLFLSKSNRYRPLGFVCTPISVFGFKHSINLITSIFHKPKAFWDKYKNIFADAMMDDLEKILPGFKSKVLFRKITTPYSIEYYTGNNNGALGGWSLTPEHVVYNPFPYTCAVKNLY
ncbi:NAD(P)/FAD-dependent oxidoreductase, partial [bacterium]